MRGKIFVTILGLLLFQALAAVYMGMSLARNFELIVAVIFLVAATSLVLNGTHARPGIGLLLVFAFGFINVVYLSFSTITLWMVIMLCLNAAGFILALELLGPSPAGRRHDLRRHEAATPLVARRRLVSKELSEEGPAQVIIYDEKEPAATLVKNVKKAEEAVAAEVVAFQRAGKLINEEMAALKQVKAVKKRAAPTTKKRRAAPKKR